MSTIVVATAFTRLRITASTTAISTIDFVDCRVPVCNSPSKLLKLAKSQVDKYCLSGQFEFELPLSPEGTAFQQRVWQLLRAIPAGQVKTYGEIAWELGSSARAVGNACRANPIPLLIPCHRVVSKSGIGGFAGDVAGGKVRIKQQLLAHEGLEF